MGARIEGLGDRFGSLDSRLGGQLADQLEPLADELRSRPGHIEIQETLAKIVDAAQSDVATQLGSLEETVLTLAEALLRPHTPQIPAPRRPAGTAAGTAAGRPAATAAGKAAASDAARRWPGGIS